MTVTVIDANHCPGSVMFLFEGYFGTILYTGDFRYEALSGSVPLDLLSSKMVDVLYLDNTYCDSRCVFPPRSQSKRDIIDLITQHPNHNVVIALRNLGKEQLLVDLANHFSTWIVVTEPQLEKLKILELPNVFTTDPMDGFIRVEPFHQLSSKKIRSWNSDGKTLIILPTSLFSGLGFQPYKNCPDTHIVPYSDHSSYSELHTFVRAIAPKRIRPIVSGSGGSRVFGMSVQNRADMSCFNDYLNPDQPTTAIVPLCVKRMMESRPANNCGSWKRKAAPAPLVFHAKRRHYHRGVMFDDSSDLDNGSESDKMTDNSDLDGKIRILDGDDAGRNTGCNLDDANIDSGVSQVEQPPFANPDNAEITFPGLEELVTTNADIKITATVVCDDEMISYKDPDDKVIPSGDSCLEKSCLGKPLVKSTSLSEHDIKEIPSGVSSDIKCTLAEESGREWTPSKDYDNKVTTSDVSDIKEIANLKPPVRITSSDESTIENNVRIDGVYINLSSHLNDNVRAGDKSCKSKQQRNMCELNPTLSLCTPQFGTKTLISGIGNSSNTVTLFKENVISMENKSSIISVGGATLVSTSLMKQRYGVTSDCVSVRTPTNGTILGRTSIDGASSDSVSIKSPPDGAVLTCMLMSSVTTSIRSQKCSRRVSISELSREYLEHTNRAKAISVKCPPALMNGTRLTTCDSDISKGLPKHSEMLGMASDEKVNFKPMHLEALHQKGFIKPRELIKTDFSTPVRRLPRKDCIRETLSDVQNTTSAHHILPSCHQDTARPLPKTSPWQIEQENMIIAKEMERCYR
ncbi:hypothetical protein LSH36_30g00032 [Paralvinella palmiformis]|uniref:5' exonuclease Apollo n=1 Tax=Paralvinella palmiformis TaxID=53620 RepID=A0AAD9NHE4_9ANNE|nr:hypothetical protein LSH36_30g00032 [Paralvinella palmiformis]